MVRNHEQAVAFALAQHVNMVGMCQLTTRTWFDAPSVGDIDRDGVPDAEDGWKAEPTWARHVGDRKPPEGVPVSWSGGDNDAGHRAISLGNGMIRSTDAGGAGRVATVALSWVEKNWGLTYLGWSETISGIRIPDAPIDPPDKTRGTRVDEAIQLLRSAKNDADLGSKRRREIRSALTHVRDISFIN